MLRPLFLISALLLSFASHAEPKHQNLTLPDQLGSAALYTPAGKPPRAGVIVVHEWWGLNDYARSRAQQLAGLGYAAVAVDMYGHGRVATHPNDAQSFMQAALAEPEKMNARFNAARDILIKQGIDSSRLFAIGYCFGGAVVLNQARMGADLAGVASFHGTLATDSPAQKGTIKARVLVANGAADPFVPPEQVTALVAEMSAADAELQLLNFPGVVHSFTNPGATAVGKANNMPLAYDEHADRSSWQALLAMIEASTR